MLINLRNALMAGRRLPYDAEVEYLESTGTQYIDTGVSGAEHNLIITAGVRINTFGAYAGAFGNYTSESANSFRLILTGSNDGQSFANCGYIVSSSHIISYFSLGNWHTVILNGAEDRCFCDGVEYTKGRRYVSGTANANTIKIFTSGGAAAGTWSKQVSAFKIELNGTLVRDFIPVRKGTVGYLYDRVTRRLFGNAGTGDFVLGQDVVPVEWLEFTGTQRLLTDIPPSVYARDLKTSISYQLTSTADRQLSGSASAYFEFCSANALVQSDASCPADLNRHTLDFIGWKMTNARVLYDGHNISQGGFVRSTNTSNRFTFGSLKSDSQSYPLKAKVSSLSMEYQDATKFLHWLPVRVGTDATSWEGAMMDVLTRRIYRNAGTGAFGYGNDLKYPIPAE